MHLLSPRVSDGEHDDVNDVLLVVFDVIQKVSNIVIMQREALFDQVPGGI